MQKKAGVFVAASDFPSTVADAEAPLSFDGADGAVADDRRRG